MFLNKLNINLLGAFMLLLIFASCKKADHNAPRILNINYPAAYIVNGTGNNISVVKLADNTVSETISLNGATYPHHIYLNPAKSKLAVAITSTDLSGGHSGGHGNTVSGQKIQIIDVVTGSIEKEIGVSKLPHNAAFSPGGAELWVPQGDTLNGTVLVFNTTDWALLKTINVGRMPSELTFSFDGSMVFVANTKDGTVSMIDPNSKVVMQTIPVGMDPVGAWPASNGKMYVDNEASQTISEIDVMTGAVSATFSLGFKPGYAAYSTHHSEVWVTDATNGKVVFFEKIAGTWTPAGSLATGADAHAIVFSANGERAYITNQGANTVTMIDVVNHTVSATINVGTKPNGIALKQ